MSTALEAAGMAAISTGAFLIAIPLGLLVAGVFAIIIGAGL